MASKRIQISQLYQGISATQPLGRRAQGTVADLYNGVCETIVGTSKRRGTICRGSVPVSAYSNKGGDPSPLNTSNFVVMNLQGKRIFVDASGQVLAYDEDGTSVEIVDTTNTGFAYLVGELTDLDWVTAYDTVIILNRSVNVVVNDETAYAVVKTVNVYSELPQASTTNTEPPVTNGYYRVLLRENSDPAGYYQYVDGAFVRVSAPNDVDSEYDLTTMPHRFVYDTNDGKIYYRTMPFKNRLSGNSKTNKVLPLEGKPILSINYFQSRLVLLNDSTLNLSANSDIYQLFVNDIDNVTVSDRISKDILENNLGTPYRTTVLGGSLLITCQNGVMCFDASNGNEVLTNINGALRKITDTKCQDLRMFNGNGIRVAILDTQNLIHTFTILDPQSGPAEYNVINNYDPRLLRGKTIRQIWMDGQDVYVLDTDGMVYIHRSEITNGQFVQLAWTRFKIANRTVRWIDAWNNYIRFTCLPEQGYTSPYMTFVDWKYEINAAVDSINDYSDEATEFNVNLDSKELVQGEYDPKTDTTRFEHTFEYADEDRSVLVDPRTGVTHRPVRINEFYVWFRGKFPSQDFTGGIFYYLGFTYDFEMTLNDLWVGASEVRLIGSKLAIFYNQTSDFDVTIGRDNGKKRTKHFSVNQYNNTVLSNTTPLATGDGPYNNPTSSGVCAIMLIGDARYTNVKISNTTAGNVTINALEYSVTPKGN